MAEIYIYTLLSVLVVSIIALIGIITLSLNKRFLQKYLFILVALAVGALLGDAFLHLIPESIAGLGATTAAIFIIAGILIFFILEKGIHWHHHHGEEEECEHWEEGGEKKGVHPVGYMIIASDSLHNFLDGIIIAASYFVSIEVGIATTIAVILHEIPQEIGDFGVLLHAGFSRARALLINFLSALTALVGAIIVLLLHEVTDSLIQILVPLAAGGFIYIAMSDLIPELHKTKKASHSASQILAIIIGVLAMLALVLVEGEEGHSHGGTESEHGHEVELGHKEAGDGHHHEEH